MPADIRKILRLSGSPRFSAGNSAEVRIKPRQAFLLLLLFLFFAPRSASEEKVPIEFESDRLEYHEETGIIKGMGNVRVIRGEARLYADYVEFHLDTGDMLAEGDVFFRDPEQEIIASRMEYNFTDASALALSAETFYKPWFVEAERFEQESPEKQRMERVSGTTCDHEVPHYRFTASRIEVEPGVAMKAYHAVFFLGRVPVLYLPYYRRSLSEEPSGLVVRPGHSEQRGMFALAYYNWYISQGFSGRWFLDYFRKLGWGKGLDLNLNYGAEKPGSGYLYLYQIDEKQAPREGEEPDERWKMHLRHSQQFSADTRSIMRVDVLSDADFTRDYLTDETLKFLSRAELERQRPEGSLSVTTRRPNYSADLYLRKRVNDFTSVVENLPRGSFNLSEQSLGDTGFYFNFFSDAAYLKQAPSEDRDDLLQARIRPGMSHQTRLWMLRMNPSIIGEGFWYDENRVGEKNIFQGTYAFNFPVNLANGIWRIYDTPGWGEMAQTRHIMLPKLTYSYRPEPDEGREDLYPFADRMGGERESVRVELRNIVEGKRADDSKFRFLYLDIYSDYNRLAEEEPWSNISLDLRADSTRDVSLRSRASYNTYIDRFETVNTDVIFRRLGWDFETGFRLYEPGGESHTFDLIARARGNLGPKWGLDLQGRYDANEGEFKALRVGVIRDLHCWEMQAFWQQEDEDTRVALAFRIKGVPGAALESPY